MKRKLILCMSLFSITAGAGEADHYSARELPLHDVSQKLNSLSNEYIEKAIDKLNASTNCNSSQASERVLYKELQKYFANHTKGVLVKEILYKDYITKRVIPLKESVYGTWSIFNGYLMGKKSAANSPLALTPMIKVGEHTIGTDKLEHMFGMGFSYFKRFHLKNIKLRKVLKRGIFIEKTLLGGNIIATGVFAYADLSANFNGMRFWNHMLQKKDDVLGKKHNLGPYIQCTDGKWQTSKENKLDFRNYVDESMDESINCSKFATRSGLKKFKAEMKKINSSYSCPMSKEALSKMYLKYKVLTPRDRKQRFISHWILNKKGNQKVSYFNEF